MSTDLTSLLTEHRPTLWRSFSNDNTIIRCAACKKDFGNATRKAKLGEVLAWTEYHAHLAAVIEASDWLAAHDREVAAGAIEAAAEAIDFGIYGWTLPNGSLNEWDHDDDQAQEVDVRDWLRARAQAIREGRA